MTLAKKNSRKIMVGGLEYRWMISTNGGSLHLLIESADISGQLLRVWFEPHDYYKRDLENTWKKSFQSVSITPEIVRKSILLGLVNGWEPEQKGKHNCELYRWETTGLLPDLPDLGDEQIRLKDLAEEAIEELRYGISLDPKWRKILFDSNVGLKHEVPDDYNPIRKYAEKYGLKFNVFNDGWTQDGFVVFAFESVQFPNLTSYSTNNSSIL